MEFFPKNLVTAWLNANFQWLNLESLLFKTKAITILTFVSHNGLAKLLALCTSKEYAHNKRALDMSEAHWTKTKTTIEGLGMIESMQCIVRIAANVCSFVCTFFDVEKGPKPFTYQLYIKTIDCITQKGLHLLAQCQQKVVCLTCPTIFLNIFFSMFLPSRPRFWQTASIPTRLSTTITVQRLSSNNLIKPFSILFDSSSASVTISPKVQSLVAFQGSLLLTPFH